MSRSLKSEIEYALNFEDWACICSAITNLYSAPIIGLEIIIGLELEIKSVIIGMENLLWVGTNFKCINNYPRVFAFSHLGKPKVL